MGRTPEPFGSMVPDPRILCEFMGHKRGPLGSFSWVEFTNLWAEPLQAHLYAQCPCAYPGCAMLLARIGPRLGIRGGELNPVLPCSPRIAVWLLLLRAATSELVEVATMRRRLGPAAVRQRSRSARRRPTGAPRAPQKHLSRA
jgi:hypothetical protein